MKSVFHVSTGLGILPGAVVLAVMILPTMTTLSVDGLRAVPDSYRQGSLALGYTRWQTIWHVVLKSAMPSLMTAVILGMTRAFGETLAVRMVIGGIEPCRRHCCRRRPPSPPRSPRLWRSMPRARPRTMFCGRSVCC